MWYKPVLKTFNVNELVKEIKVKANSFNGSSLPDVNVPDYGFGSSFQPGCLVEVCWYGASCDVIPVL